MRLNLDKCLLCQTEIEYLGETSAAGVKPFSRKVKAVRNMCKPQNQEDLKGNREEGFTRAATPCQGWFRVVAICRR